MRKRGFTLVELMVVVAIIGMLAAIVAVNVVGYGDEARRTTAKTEIAVINDAIKTFRIEKGRAPRDLSELFGPQRTYLADKTSADQLVDPWGTRYAYVPPGADGRWDVISYGGNKLPGGEGVDADIHLVDALTRQTE